LGYTRPDFYGVSRISLYYYGTIRSLVPRDSTLIAYSYQRTVSPSVVGYIIVPASTPKDDNLSKSRVARSSSFLPAYVQDSNPAVSDK